MIVEDENKFNDILKDSLILIELYLRLKILKHLYNIFDSPTDYNIMKLAIFITKFYFEYNINKLLKEQESVFLDNFNKRSSPINIVLEEEADLLFFKSFISF